MEKRKKPKNQNDLDYTKKVRDIGKGSQETFDLEEKRKKSQIRL